MEHLTWSASEKRVARAVFERALESELSELITEFKVRVASIESPEEMWSLREYLENTQRDIQSKYDFRYSQLLFVFGRLLRERRIQEKELRGLDEAKMEYVRTIAGL